MVLGKSCGTRIRSLELVSLLLNCDLFGELNASLDHSVLIYKMCVCVCVGGRGWGGFRLYQRSSIRGPGPSQ